MLLLSPLLLHPWWQAWLRPLSSLFLLLQPWWQGWLSPLPGNYCWNVDKLDSLCSHLYLCYCKLDENHDSLHRRRRRHLYFSCFLQSLTLFTDDLYRELTESPEENLSAQESQHCNNKINKDGNTGSTASNLDNDCSSSGKIQKVSFLLTQFKSVLLQGHKYGEYIYTLSFVPRKREGD